MPELNFGRKGYQILKLEDKLVVLGGTEQGLSIEYFSKEKNCWTLIGKFFLIVEEKKYYEDEILKIWPLRQFGAYILLKRKAEKVVIFIDVAKSISSNRVFIRVNNPSIKYRPFNLNNRRSFDNLDYDEVKINVIGESSKNQDIDVRFINKFRN